MGANIAGIYGAQIFRQDDRPRYRRGFTINIGVLALGLALAAVRFLDAMGYARKGWSHVKEFFRKEQSNQHDHASGRSSSESPSEEEGLAGLPRVDEKGQASSGSSLRDNKTPL